MKIERCEMPSFAVIGKEGSTEEGNGFIQRLWENANGHFDEVARLAARDEQGNLLGIWGAMSDMSRSFHPWEDDFTKGLYLAGVQCRLEEEAPAGWTKWVIPAYVYLFTECTETDVFARMLAYIRENGMELAGAVHDFTCPQTGKNYMFFPIEKR